MTTVAELTGDVRTLGSRMIASLGLHGSPVGVRLVPTGSELPADTLRLRHHRYCQAVMLARRGAVVVLDGAGLACPAASRAFGFKPLPAQLESGKGLVGFGIVARPDVGARMFERMPRLPASSLAGLHLFPLDRSPAVPDIVLVEDEIEKLMWITLAYMHATGGERVTGTTAVLQAVCADATIVPYLEDRLNFTYGCYGCRDATDIGRDETLVGFPVSFLDRIVEHLEYLGRQAIPASRSKRALWALAEREPAGAGGATHTLGQPAAPALADG